MASPNKDSTVPTAKNVPKTGASSATPEIAHVVPIDVITPMPAIENAPIVKPDPKPVLQTSMEAKAISPQKEKATKTKKIKTIQKTTTIVSYSEFFDEPTPTPKARKPTQKRRRIVKKTFVEAPSTEVPPLEESAPL